MVNRRNSLKTLAAAALALPRAANAANKPIHLHVDLDVTPGKEKILEDNFAKIFRPTISKQPGFVEVKLLKFQAAKMGEGPKNASYRLIISFQTEEQRVKWVATADHQKVWPSMEGQLRGAKFSAWLYDVI
jgi:antibiotic biosynthesis monooxygenase (ABM) superfamily enzyme